MAKTTISKKLKEEAQKAQQTEEAVISAEGLNEPQSEEVASVPDPEPIDSPAEQTKEPLAEEPIVTKEIEIPPAPAYRKELDKSLPFEDRIVAFLESRGAGQIFKINDFLKSLYPIPQLNAPPTWMDQAAMKRLRVTLDNMQSHGKLTISNNSHAKLGTHYYEGVEQFARFHNLNTVPIEAKL